MADDIVPPHLLVVDEETQVLRAVEELLRDQFVVHGTSDEGTALRVLEQETITVMMIDQRMGQMDTDRVLGRAAEVSLATRVLLTGYTDLEAVVRAVARGHIYAYVAKPLHPLEIRLTLARAKEHHDLVRKLDHERFLLHQLMENVPDAIYFKDDSHRFTRVNAAKARLLGIENPDELRGRGDWDFFPSGEAAKIEQDDIRVAQEGVPVIDLVECYTPPDGRQRWFSTTKVPLRGYGLVGISRDITERRHAEHRLDKITRQLVQAETEKKAFYREVVLAVTGGKFHLVDRDELPPLPEPSWQLSLEEPENYRAMRDRLTEEALAAGFTEDEAGDLVLAAGEAATNAIKHAQGGTCTVGWDDAGAVVRIADAGSGIQPQDLPHTLFKKGFSTKVSLGLGYTLLLSVTDGLWLATGPEGTVLQMTKRPGNGDQDEADLLQMLERYGG